MNNVKTILKHRDKMTEVRDDMMRSSSPASLNSLQIALQSMKERCTRQQKKIEDLEQDNIMLSASRNDLYTELKKVHESNEKLRARNVGLSHELHLKSRELTEVKELWDRDRGRHEDSVRQLERLQEDILRRSDMDTVSSLSDSDVISSLRPEDDEKSDDDDTQEAMDDDKKMLEASKEQMAGIKITLVTQQSQLKAALETLRQRRAVTDQSAERLISTVLTSAMSSEAASGGSQDQPHHVEDSGGQLQTKCCPMCEAVFPGDITQEEFESHVVEHFSYEESETLRNFDTVPDAFWPGIEHNPEM